MWRWTGLEWVQRDRVFSALGDGVGVVRMEEAADGRCDPVYILRARTGSRTGAAGGKGEASEPHPSPYRAGRAGALAAFPLPEPQRSREFSQAGWSSLGFQAVRPQCWRLFLWCHSAWEMGGIFSL